MVQRPGEADHPRVSRSVLQRPGEVILALGGLYQSGCDRSAPRTHLFAAPMLIARHAKRLNQSQEQQQTSKEKQDV